LFERFESRLHVAPGPVVPIANAREFMFKALTDSFQQVDAILAADREAVAGKDVYDDAYFEMLLKKTQPILEQRIDQSITGVASMITAAWVEAGKPALPPDTPPRTPRKVRRNGQ